MRVAQQFFRILAWIFVSLLGLILLVYLLIQLPAVQDYARGRVVVWLEGKLKTKVEIGHLSVTLPRRVILEDVYFEDQKGDTLLAGDKLRVDITLLKLLDNIVEVKYLQLDNVRANIYRVHPDTVFNFDYIVQAFATQPKDAPVDSAAALQFHLDKFVLNRVFTTYRDDEIGSDMYFNIGNMSATVDSFDPYKFIYSFPSINLHNSVVRMKQYKPLATPRPMAEVEAKNAPPKADFQFGTLNIRNVNFSYDNDVSAINTTMQLGQLYAEAESLDLDSLFIDLRTLEMKNSNTAITVGRSEQAKIAVTEVKKDLEAQANNPWRIRVGDIFLLDNNIKYDDHNLPRQRVGIDYAHLDMQDLDLDATNVVFQPENIQAVIEQASFTEQSGVVLKTLQANLLYDDNKLSIENLYLQTDKSVIRRRVVLTYDSFEAMSKRPGDTYLEADIESSTVAVRDIISFAPQLRNVIPFKGNEHEVFNIDATVRGYLKDLSIPNLNVSSFRNSSIAMSGTIKNMTSANPYYDLVVSNFRTTKADLVSFLPRGTIPNNIRLPDAMSGRAVFKGTPNNYNTRLVAQTNRGNVDLLATVNGQRYKARVAAQGFDIGYVFMQPNIGRASFHANVTGNGFDLQRSPMDIDSYVSSVYLNGYTYNNIKFTGNIRNGVLTGEGDMNDTNADLDFALVTDLKQETPSLDLRLSIDSVNLFALGFSDLPFKLHGDININMPSMSLESLQGTATITDVVFVRDGRRYKIDSISLVASVTPAGNVISLTSALGVAELKGRYKLDEIAFAVQNIIHRYYKLPGYTPKSLTSQQNWTLTATLFPSKMLYEFAPEIDGTDTVNLVVDLNTTDNFFRAEARTRKLMYNGQYADSLTFAATTAGDQLLYSATAFAAGNKNIKVFRTSAAGSLANDLLSVRLDVKDRKDNSRYQVSGVAASIPGGFRFSLNQDSLMFDYEQWAVGAGNYIQSTTAGMVVHNFTISNGLETLSANSTALVPNSPIELQFRDFNISTITRIINQDSLLMGGVINGSALLSDVANNPSFTSDVVITDFNYKGDTLGTITGKINNQTQNTLAADITIRSDSNDISLNGRYMISTQTMDMKMVINKFDLSSVKPFLTEQIRDIDGNISGEMDVSGKISAPKLNGNIRFEHAYIAPALLGERFYLPNDDLRVTPGGIRLDNFVIRDSLGGKAIIDGSITTTDFSDFEYDFYLYANDFRLVNTQRTANSMYFGQLNADLDLAVYGSVKTPTLEGNIRINEATNFFAVLPGSNPEVVTREGVVNFVDKEDPEDSIFINSTYIADSILNNMDVAGLDLAVTIETDTAAQFNLIIDDLTGDILAMRGKADLAAGIDRSGKISLTGNYELNSGHYELSFQFIRRRFELIKGSTVTWTGDPTDAIVNASAVYVANTSSINLVEPQIRGRAQAEMNRYKERIPFNIMLYLNGQLMEPVITFDIQLPEGYASAWKEVDDKLIQMRRDQAELNKQVFAVLLLGRFVQENPFQDAGAGVTAASIVRQSVSRILTEQLNQWASGLVQGFDLTFGVQSIEDYSTGELQNRTDLTVAVSKQLLNDRMRVTIGSAFGIEGPSNSRTGSQGFANDIAIDYLLTKDGRYRVRAYRRNIYEVVVEGQVVETGLKFIVSMDYDKFQELFKRKKDDAITPRRRTTTNTSEEVPKPVENEQ